MKNKLLVGISVVGAFLASATSSFAAAPVVNATVSADTNDLITGLGTAGITGLSLAILAGGVLLVTAALVFWVIKHFRAMVHI